MEVLMQGLVLLVAGMGIVFLFLSLLVWVMNRSAAIIPRFNRILPDEEPRKKARPARAAEHHAQHGDDTAVAVAIAAISARAA
jgi:sodium pump decarboxylase gamma subunit